MVAFDSHVHRVCRIYPTVCKHYKDGVQLGAVLEPRCHLAFRRIDDDRFEAVEK